MEDPLLPKLESLERAASGEDLGEGPERRFVPEDFLSPALGTTVLLPFAVAFTGVIVSSNPVLAPHTPTLLSTVIMSQGLGSLFFSFFSQYRTCTNIDLLSAAYLAQLGTALHKEAEINEYYNGKSAESSDGEDLGARLLVQILVGQGLFTMLVGFLIIMIAKLDGVWYLRFFPYPVACGFVSGIGFLILDGGFELGCGAGMRDLIGGIGTLPLMTYAHMGITVAVGGMFVLLRRVITNATRLPIGLLLVTLLVHFGGRSLGFDHKALDDLGMFMHGLDAESWTASWSSVINGIGKMDISGFGSQSVLSLTVSYSLLHLLCYPFYAIGMQDIDQPPEKFDTKKEIMMLGKLNMVLGCLFGVPSCHSYKVCIVMKDAGARTRVWVILLGSTFMALYFDTSVRPWIALVPKCAFGGLVFSLGFEFLMASLFESRQRVASEEWRLVLFTALMTYFNVLAGLVVGCLLTMGSFVVEYAGITGITNQATFSEVRSLLKRPKEEAELLGQHGNMAVVFWCSGYIFFGTASTIVEEIEAYLDDNPKTKFIIIDFEAVPAVDASGVHSLTEFANRCTKRKPKVRVCFCGLVRRLNLALKNVIASKHIQEGPRLYSRRVEEALEWAEDEILRRAKRGHPDFQRMETSPLGRQVSPGSLPLPDGGQAEAAVVQVQGFLAKMLLTVAPEASQDDIGAVAAELAPCTQLLVFAAARRHVSEAVDQNAGVIFLEGACAYDLYYLVSGKAELRRALEGECSVKLPRHHLNTQKGDMFVFEERTEIRVETVHEGALLGLVEFAASQGMDTLHVGNRPKRLNTAAASPRCKALRVPFHELHAALERHTMLGHAALARLGRMAASQVIELSKCQNVKPYRVTASPAEVEAEAEAADAEASIPVAEGIDDAMVTATTTDGKEANGEK